MVIYNSLSLKKELLSPLYPKKILMYVCGITPYDTTHLGHAFTYVFFDVVFRYLTVKGYSVFYTQNVTDIDDDILKRAREEGKNWREFGNFWTKKFLVDLKALNVIKPTYYIKATDSIPKIIEITKALIKKNFAYGKDGNVYFRVKKFLSYGKLSKLTRTEMIELSKERGADPNDPLKEDPLDFILWQKSKNDEPFWNSPWGKGRPGWHIECSTMIHQYLGDQIDIHGGGQDLAFPHHESEIAQSESFTGKSPFVRNWMHTAMVSCKGEKMSKSLGNLVMISDLLKSYRPETIRFMLLSYYYRKPWEFHENTLLEADRQVKTIFKAAGPYRKQKSSLKKLVSLSKKMRPEKELDDFFRALEDDFDMPLALMGLVAFSKKVLQEKNPTIKEKLQQMLFEALSILGLL